jgi:hypothetical protein
MDNHVGVPPSPIKKNEHQSRPVLVPVFKNYKITTSASSQAATMRSHPTSNVRNRSPCQTRSIFTIPIFANYGWFLQFPLSTDPATAENDRGA